MEIRFESGFGTFMTFFGLELHSKRVFQHEVLLNAQHRWWCLRRVDENLDLSSYCDRGYCDLVCCSQRFSLSENLNGCRAVRPYSKDPSCVPTYNIGADRSHIAANGLLSSC